MTNDETIPNHLGLILDGNRRWAKTNGIPTQDVYRIAYDNLKDVAKAAFDKGVIYVSAYIFSTENWNRSIKEVSFLMSLAYKLLVADVDELHEENIRIIWMGSEEKINKKLVKGLHDAEELTKNNTKGTLCLCFNYGGQQEIADSLTKLIEKGGISGRVSPEMIEENLYHPEVPAIDLMIRTSGEQRLSNFMLWRVSYSEMSFCDKFWPDFSKDDLQDYLNNYAQRDRRNGK
jgi:undecaprenyl diphosphate synthase